MDFDFKPVLSGKLVQIEPLQSEDFESLYQAASDPLIWEQHPASQRHQLNEFKKFFEDILNLNGSVKIIDQISKKIIGTTSFYQFSSEKKEIAIGYTFIQRQYWGGKYNSEIKKLMLHHAFRYVNKAIFHVGINNTRSQKAMEKLGALKSGPDENIMPNGDKRIVFTYCINKDATKFPMSL